MVEEPLDELLQVYDCAPVANTEPEAPAQNTVGNVSTEITGSGFTTTLIVTVEEQAVLEELTPETV